jgi:hypothetical protein
MKNKATYRIRNWSRYNAALRQRRSLTVWFSDAALAHWTTDERTGARGASPTYTDLAIETIARRQAIYHLAGRQTQGFPHSLFQLLQLDLTAPDHSTLSQQRGIWWWIRPGSKFAAKGSRKCGSTAGASGGCGASSTRIVCSAGGRLHCMALNSIQEALSC